MLRNETIHDALRNVSAFILDFRRAELAPSFVTKSLTQFLARRLALVLLFDPRASGSSALKRGFFVRFGIAP
jgi:hypothetical protein